MKTAADRIRTGFLAVAVFLSCGGSIAWGEETLASWNEGPAKHAIIEFVARATDESGKDFVPPAQRIAVFDNDGTLWSEQPIYFQFAFVFDRIRALAPQHPEWKTKQPYQAVIEGDMKTLFASGENPGPVDGRHAFRHDNR